MILVPIGIVSFAIFNQYTKHHFTSQLKDMWPPINDYNKQVIEEMEQLVENNEDGIVVKTFDSNEVSNEVCHQVYGVYEYKLFVDWYTDTERYARRKFPNHEITMKIDCLMDVMLERTMVETQPCAPAMFEELFCTVVYKVKKRQNP